jgi:hypothetical protein
MHGVFPQPTAEIILRQVVAGSSPEFCPRFSRRYHRENRFLLAGVTASARRHSVCDFRDREKPGPLGKFFRRTADFSGQENVELPRVVVKSAASKTRAAVHVPASQSIVPQCHAPPRQDPIFRQNRENRQNRKICSFPNIRQPKPIFRMQSTRHLVRSATRRIGSAKQFVAVNRVRCEKVLLGGNATIPVHSSANGSWLPPRRNRSVPLAGNQEFKTTCPMLLPARSIPAGTRP